jgi:hypothetical protein
VNELAESTPKRGRPTILPGRPLTLAERSKRWRARHPKPKPDFDLFPGLQTFEQLAGLVPPQQPEKPPFDPRALIG